VLDVNISKCETMVTQYCMQPNFLGTKLVMMSTQPDEVSHQLKTIVTSSAFQLKFNTLSAFFNLSIISLRLLT
jgi:hypothetical protein